MGQIVNARSIVYLPGGDASQRKTVQAALDEGPTTGALATGLVAPSAVAAIRAAEISVDTVAALKAINPAAAVHAVVRGYYAAGDWGAPRIARFSTSSSATDDGGFSVSAPTSGTGRWLWDLGPRISPLWGGAKADGQIFATGAVDVGVNASLLTVTGASFTTADVGKNIAVDGAGAAGARLATTIATRVSATQVTLTAAASTTVTAARVTFGSDDRAIINTMIALAKTAKLTVECPESKIFGISQWLTIPNGLRWTGRGSTFLLLPQYTTSGGAFIWWSATSWSIDIEDMTFDCNHFNINPVQGSAGINNSRFRRCKFLNCDNGAGSYSTGLLLFNSSNTIVEDCDFDTVNFGVLAQSGGTKVHILRCRANNVYQYGFEFSNATSNPFTRSSIRHCEVTNSLGHASQIGVKTGSFANIKFEDIWVTDNYCEGKFLGYTGADAGGTADILTTYGIRRCTIERNHTRGAGDLGIAFENAEASNCNNNCIEKANQYGIGLVTAVGCTINGNTIHDCGIDTGYGTVHDLAAEPRGAIWITDFDGLTVDGNACRNLDTTAKYQQFGIIITNPPTTGNGILANKNLVIGPANELSGNTEGHIWAGSLAIPATCQIIYERHRSDNLLISCPRTMRQDITTPTTRFMATALANTKTTATSAAAATTLTVASISGFASGQTISVLLDDRSTHVTTINGAPSGSTITLTAGIPGGRSVAVGAYVRGVTWTAA